MKIDEDVAVHVQRLKYWIENKYTKMMLEEDNNKLIFGHMNRDKMPIRNKEHKWC